ncbi:MAG: flagellin FliC [Candidatus Nitrohelix vancouverensis]|uniref:Flagellin n=1 Tax=Candidatus Nitrohelix vancouverensis TaxID=2705534 RepID=A0A7T0G2L7_9BACT|nr:MAG: flagellin FliC [Candidatus Nitrohelix vancouverensis]
MPSSNFGGLDGILNSIQKNRSGIGSSLSKIASGRRLTSAGVDPAANALSEQLRSEIRSLTQAVQNAETGGNFLRTADSGLASVGDLLARGRELATQAANGTLDSSQRAAIDQEFNQIREEIDRTAQSLDFNGQKLLDGSLSAGSSNPVDIQVGSGSGPENQISVNVVENVSSASLGIDQTDLSTSQGALQALDDIDQAIAAVTSSRGEVGATSNRLSSAGRGLESTIENLKATESNLGDTDLSSEISNLQLSLTRFETSIRALTLRNQINEGSSGGLLNTII